MDYKAMGKRIRKQRIYLGYTQEQLAEKAGISASFVGHIEQATRIPSLETLIAFCQALDVTPNFLLQDNFENVSPSLDFPPNLSPRQITALQEVVNSMTQAIDNWNAK